jgi:hypothetical protein
MKRVIVGLVAALLGLGALAEAGYCPPQPISLVRRAPKGRQFHHYIRGCERPHHGSGTAASDTASRRPEKSRKEQVAASQAEKSPKGEGRAAAGSR